MSEYQFVALMLAGLGPVLALARAVGAPGSVVLFGLGLASAWVPFLPQTPIDPKLVLNLFLPPLLYASTVRVTWHLLRFTWRPGLLGGVALVAATIAAVAGAASLVLLPGLSWSGALLIGAMAALFDTRLFHEAKGRPHVPRAIADTLKARELVGRIVTIATFSLVVETVMAGGVSAPAAAEHYLVDIPAGMLVGFLVGHAVAFARRHIDPAPVEIAVSVATPYGAALVAGALGLSVVGAVTLAALVVSAVRIDRDTGAPISSSETRVSATAFWEQVNLMVSSALFFLAGRALPQALGALQVWPLWQVLAAAAGVLALVLAVQFAVSYLSAGLPPLREAVGPGAERRAQAAAAMAWSSTRSVIALVVALSIPVALPDGRPFPDRDLVLVVAALTIVGSVVLQGLTLRPVVAGVHLADEAETEGEEALARRTIERALAAPRHEHANGFDAARQELVRLREADRIGDEVLVSMLRETDLMARAAEGDALPGAGPPNP